ncbi:MAG: RNA polymerase sigma factor [Anaeromyxobacteraceae bacterium]
MNRLALAPNRDPIAPRRSPAPGLSDARMVALGEAEVEATQQRAEDVALLRRVAARDRGAFEALYEQYAPRLGGYALRLLKDRDAVDEVIDDVMLAVWQNASRFDPAVARLSTWLFGITHHKALTRLARSPPRREALRPEAEAGADCGDGDDQQDAALDPEHAAMGRQLGAALADALGRLSPDHRAVIELAFAEGQSYQEIAAVIGAPLNTVKTRMFHARKHLARFLRWRGDRDGRTTR